MGSVDSKARNTDDLEVKVERLRRLLNTEAIAIEVRGRLVHLETACFLSSVDPDILLAMRPGVGGLLPGSSDDFPLKRGVTNVSDFTIFAEFLRDGTRGAEHQESNLKLRDADACLAILRMHTRLRLQPAPLALVARTLYEKLGPCADACALIEIWWRYGLDRAILTPVYVKLVAAPGEHFGLSEADVEKLREWRELAPLQSARRVYRSICSGRGGAQLYTRPELAYAYVERLVQAHVLRFPRW